MRCELDSPAPLASVLFTTLQTPHLKTPLRMELPTASQEI